MNKNVYYVLATIYGSSHGIFETKEKAIEIAKENKCKYILRVNPNKCPGTRGSIIKYKAK